MPFKVCHSNYTLVIILKNKTLGIFGIENIEYGIKFAAAKPKSNKS